MIRIIVSILVCIGLGWLLCDIHPGEHYTWFSGIWHGLFACFNWVRSLFTDALVKADSGTTAYNVFFWIFAILSIPSFLSFVFGGRR